MKRLISLIVIITTLSLLSCGPGRKLTKADYVLGAAYTVAKAGDAYTTMEGMDRGAIEKSPLLGEHPSDGMVILSSVIITGIMWLILKYTRPTAGRTVVGINTGITGVAVKRNLDVLNNIE